MAVASLIISILALIATGTAATVAIMQARTAKTQSDTALRSLRLQREAALVVKVASYMDGSHQWRFLNQGRAHAREVRIYLSFDADQREFGSLSLGDIGPDGLAIIKTKKPLGHVTDYVSFGPGSKMKTPFVTAEWRNIDDEPRSRRLKIDVLPGIAPDEIQDDT